MSRGTGSVVQLVISPKARRPVTVEVIMFYTYMIENPQGVFYKGSTSDYHKRVKEHNEGLNASTRNKGPWKLVFLTEFETRKESEDLEKRLKKCNKIYLRWLLSQPVNILNKNLDR